MEFYVIDYKHCTVFQGKGRIDSYTAPDYEKALNDLVEKGHYNIVFDMENINFVSSSGWRALIMIQKVVKRYNRGRVVLVNVDPRIKSSMDLIGITSYFTLFDDLTSAVGSF